MQQESKDRTFLVTMQVTGHGRSEQLLNEFSDCLERMMYQEFGESGFVESIIELNGQDHTDEKPPTICSGDG